MHFVEVAGNQEAAVGVVVHPQSDGLFLTLQQYQVGEHPFTENALGPCFYVQCR